MPIRKSSLSRGDVLCLLAILGLATLFLAPALRPGYTLLPLGLESGIAPWHKQVDQQPQNPLLSDPFYQYYPFRHLITESLRRGEFALWNPYILGGHPMMGDLLAQTFYPPSIVGSLLLPLARAWVFLIWGHLWMTGVLMYGYLRHISLRSASALFGAIAWMFNAAIVVWLESPHFLSTIAWLPGIFWLLSIGKARRRWSTVAGAGMLYGLLILAGQIQYAIGAAWLIGVWGVFQAVAESIRQRHLVLWPLIAVLVAGVLGVGIGMVQLAPALEFAQLSHRVSFSTFHINWPVDRIITLWMPDFYGNPARSWWRDLNIAEVSAYFGLWPFILSVCTLVWSKRLDGRFWGSMLFVMLLIVLDTPAAHLVRWLPGTRYIRLARLLILVPFVGGIAAAFSLDAAYDQLLRHPRRVWATLALVILLLVIASAVIVFPQLKEVLRHHEYLWPQVGVLALLLVIGFGGWILISKRRTWGTVFIVLASCVDLMAWGMPFNPVNSLNILYPENKVTDWLRQDASLYRTLPLHTDRVVFGPNVLSVFGLYESGGYSSLMIGRYKELVRAIDGQVDIRWMRNRNMVVNSRFDPLFSLLNVKYVLAPDQLDQPLISVDAALPSCVEPGLPLTAGTRITQTFRALHPGLNRVDIEFVPTSDPVGQPVRFLLWRDREDGELLADITAEALPEQGPLVSYFAPITDSAGQAFVWALETGGEGEIAICQAEGGPPGQLAFHAYSVQLQLADIRQGVWIYENPNILPRAYVVHKVEVAPDPTVLDRLTSPDFNAWTTALLEEPLPSEQMAALKAAPSRTGSTVQITHYGSHRVELEAEMAAPGLLILGDTYYPGWEVTVDDAPASLLQVNYALRGVYLPSGAHHIVFRFVPKVFYIGLILTGVTVVCSVSVILLWEICHHVRRQDPPD
jgi:hypothetical protein